MNTTEDLVENRPRPTALHISLPTPTVNILTAANFSWEGKVSILPHTVTRAQGGLQLGSFLAVDLFRVVTHSLGQGKDQTIRAELVKLLTVWGTLGKPVTLLGVRNNVTLLGLITDQFGEGIFGFR